MGVSVGTLMMAAPAAFAQARAPEAAQEPAATLPSVTVRDKANAVTAPYAGGQVTTGGRVGLLGDKDFMETPFNTISYTDAYIADRQAQDIGAAISATDPSVFSNNVSGAWSENYSIRGFASTSTDMSVNGLYGMAPYYRGTTEMYERVEVLKGPSALLNGMPPGGSVGGSINLVPKRAGDTPITRFTGTYTSESQLGGHLDVGRRFGEDKQFGIRFNGVYRNGDGPVNQQEKKAQLASVGLDWRGNRVRLSTDMYVSDDYVKGVTRGLTLAAGVDVPAPPKATTLLSPNWGYVRNRDRGIMARGEFDLNDQVSAYIAAGTSKSNYEYNGASAGQVLNANGNFRTTIAQLRFQVDKTSLDTGLKGSFKAGSVGHQWALNVTHYRDRIKEVGNRVVSTWDTNIYNPVWGPALAFNGGSPITHTETRLNSVGLADTMSFAQDRVQLTLGLRHQSVTTDTMNAATGVRTGRYDASAVSPAAALLVKATDHVSVYANYIQGLSKGQVAPDTTANRGEVFAPYKTEQKELGVKIDLGDFAHTLSLYQIDKPSAATDPLTNIFAVNGEQRNRGLEWGFFGTPLRGIRAMGGIAYSDPKLTKALVAANQGKMATGVPRLQGKLGVEWDLPAAQGLTLTANATAVSRQYINATNTQWVSGHTTYDLGARYKTRLDNTPVTLRASILNVTNKAYWGMPLITALALGAPRTLMVSASVDF